MATNVDNILTVVNTGTMAATTDNQATAIILSKDGSKVKQIRIWEKIRGKEKKIIGEVEITINFETGKVFGEIRNSSNRNSSNGDSSNRNSSSSDIGHISANLTVNGAKVPEIRYEKWQKVERVYTKENIKEKGARAIRDDLWKEIGKRLTEIREAHGVDRKKCLRFSVKPYQTGLLA